MVLCSVCGPSLHVLDIRPWGVLAQDGYAKRYGTAPLNQGYQVEDVVELKYYNEVWQAVERHHDVLATQKAAE